MSRRFDIKAAADFVQRCANSDHGAGRFPGESPAAAAHPSVATPATAACPSATAAADDDLSLLLFLLLLIMFCLGSFLACVAASWLNVATTGVKFSGLKIVG